MNNSEEYVEVISRLLPFLTIYRCHFKAPQNGSQNKES